MSFLCTAEQRTHVTDKTLYIGDFYLSVQLSKTNLNFLVEKNVNTTHSTFKSQLKHRLESLIMVSSRSLNTSFLYDHMLRYGSVIKKISLSSL